MSAASPSLSAPGPNPALGRLGYFQHPLATGLILGSFAFVTLPLLLLLLHFPGTALIWLFVWLFGMTHLVLTFTLYLQSANLRHFAKNWRNQAVFFGVPVAIFVGFDLYGALGVAVLFPLLNLGFRGVLRLVEFCHFSRQCYGVLQMFKTESGSPFPAWLKSAENAFFLSLAALMQCTFLEGVRCSWAEGTFDPLALAGARFPLLKDADPDAAFWGLCLRGVSGAVLAVALTFGAAVVAGYARAQRSGVGQGAVKPLLYVMAQTVSGALAITFLPLYIATLAIHYVEYHVVMMPRYLRTPLDPHSRIDRVFGRARRNPWVFYALLIGVSGIITLIVRQSMGTMMPGAADLGRPLTIGLLLAVFDGLFLFHHFIEIHVWRFSDPYFRQSMAGLYFAPSRPAEDAGGR